ncbi:hypothetical protein HYALB_00007694 [Hymenoscyphus albidus]|uniref:DHHA2 domain-containing protein n=1 Tax=Hymenoscyphus albidus TaxID=595503 RepID=A0A9N9LE94_9HELO|nr:hypothetical protein HYALB_00007694 [Hymenoscyphus albidus]
MASYPYPSLPTHLANPCPRTIPHPHPSNLSPHHHHKMSLPRTSLHTFLKTARSHLQNQHKNPSSTPLTFVIGNESADLDSLCSAILLAYLKTYTGNDNGNSNSNGNGNVKGKGKGFYIPLSNLKRTDLRLRPELKPVLSHANFEVGDLLTLCDLPFSLSADQTKDTNGDREEGKGQDEEKEKTRWFLVDHNLLTGPLGQAFNNRIIGVIDHHVDEGQHTALALSPEGEGRVIKTVGSCASLIVQTFLDSWPSSREMSCENWDREVAALALGAIVVDTMDLGDKGKTTEVDCEAVGFLEGLMKGEGGFDRKGYFEEIERAKGDVDSLSLAEIFRKDYKSWTERDVNLGISASVKNLSFLLEKGGGKEGFLGAVEEFSNVRELDLFAVMTTFQGEGGFMRELFLYARNARSVKVAERFERDARERLGLRGWKEGVLDGDGDEGWRRCWVQEKTENSRKQVAPLLREAML